MALGVGVAVLVDVAADVSPAAHGAVPHPLRVTTKAVPRAAAAAAFFQLLRIIRHSPLPSLLTPRMGCANLEHILWRPCRSLAESLISLRHSCIHDRDEPLREAPAGCRPRTRRLRQRVHRLVDAPPSYRPTIGCIIPAYNEADSIAEVLESLLAQTRLPDVIHVVVNNTTDKTVEIASALRRPAQPHRQRRHAGDRGLHPRHRREPRQEGRRAQLRLLARRGLRLPARRRRRHHGRPDRGRVARGGDRLRHPHRRHLGDLLDRRRRRSRAPWPSSSSPASAPSSPPSTCRTCSGAATWPCSAASSRSSRSRPCARSWRQNHQATPWVKDSEVEDSLLSLQIKSAGYLTKIRPAPAPTSAA